jgi:hypothetical protein
MKKFSVIFFTIYGLRFFYSKNSTQFFHFFCSSGIHQSTAQHANSGTAGGREVPPSALPLAY